MYLLNRLSLFCINLLIVYFASHLNNLKNKKTNRNEKGNFTIYDLRRHRVILIK